MKTKSMAIAVGGIAALITSQAWAQTATPVKSQYEIPTTAKSDDDGPRGVMLGDGVAFYPYADLGLGQDDNLFLTNTNKKSSAVQSFRPGFKVQARSQASLFTASVDGNIGRYTDSKADNYSDVIAKGTAEFVASSSLGFRVGLDYERGHDPRGSTDRGFSTSPDEFKKSGFGGLVAYGANDAQGRIELELGTFRKRYQNNRGFTFASDRDGDNLAGRFFWRIAPKTSALFEIRQDKMDYTFSGSLQDSKEQRYFVGLTWDATAATSGTVKAGRIRKDFAAGSVPDFTGTGWEAAIQWAPMTYSRFEFTTQKSFGESSGIGDFTLTKRFGASWTHDWNSQFTTTASISRADDDFARATRDDSTDALGFKVIYKVQRWLKLGGEYAYTDRGSNIPGFNYKKSLYMFTVGATL
jgi:polysaccharide biosynthesis protein VpsM